WIACSQTLTYDDGGGEIERHQRHQRKRFLELQCDRPGRLGSRGIGQSRQDSENKKVGENPATVRYYRWNADGSDVAQSPPHAPVLAAARHARLLPTRHGCKKFAQPDQAG